MSLLNHNSFKTCNLYVSAMKCRNIEFVGFTHKIRTGDILNWVEVENSLHLNNNPKYSCDAAFPLWKDFIRQEWGCNAGARYYLLGSFPTGHFAPNPVYIIPDLCTPVIYPPVFPLGILPFRAFSLHFVSTPIFSLGNVPIVVLLWLFPHRFFLSSYFPHLDGPYRQKKIFIIRSILVKICTHM